MITLIAYLIVSFVLLDFTWFDLLLIEENGDARLFFSVLLICFLVLDYLIILDQLEKRKENE